MDVGNDLDEFPNNFVPDGRGPSPAESVRLCLGSPSKAGPSGLQVKTAPPRSNEAGPSGAGPSGLQFKTAPLAVAAPKPKNKGGRPPKKKFPGRGGARVGNRGRGPGRNDGIYRGLPRPSSPAPESGLLPKPSRMKTRHYQGGLSKSPVSVSPKPLNRK